MFMSDKKWIASIQSPEVHVQIQKKKGGETSNIKVVTIWKEKGKTSSAIYDNTIVFIFLLSCLLPANAKQPQIVNKDFNCKDFLWREC